MKVSASIDSGDDFLLSGFWEEWQTSGANGMPIIVHQTTGARDVTLIGIDATFRGASGKHLSDRRQRYL